jgi:PBSX family phage terminase large subunit
MEIPQDTTNIPEIIVESSAKPVTIRERKLPKTAWKPGQSGNPKGRAKNEKTLTELLRMEGDKLVEVIDATTGVKRTLTKKERLAEVVWEQAMTRQDKSFVKLAYERIDGLPIATDPNAGKNVNDTDFGRYRLRTKLFDEQSVLLLTKKRRTDMLCGRRSGKTVSIAAKMVDMALSHTAGTLLYVTKTFGQAYKNIWRYLIEFLDLVGVEYKASSSTGEIDVSTGCRVVIAGSDTLDAVEKLRGQPYLGVFIDEIQSLKYAKYLVNDVVKPALRDYADSILVLSGTPSRTAETQWEKWWKEQNPDVLKLHWTMEQNVTMPETERSFEKIKADEGLTDDSPRFLREYMGVFMYDKEAQVFKPTDATYYHPDEFKAWVEKHRAPTYTLADKFEEQTPTHQFKDIEFTGGLDYGFSDSDAFVIIAYSTSMKERFVLYEYKQNHTDVATLAAEVRKGLDKTYNEIPLFKSYVDDGQFTIYADYGGGGAKISSDLRNTYQLPVVNAIKQNKDLAIDMMQVEINRGQLKILAGGVFDKEMESIVWRRDEDENIIRDIDDDAFHPDMMDALLYAMRPVWKYSNALKE